MTDCPKLSAASDNAVLSEARWYALAAALGLILLPADGGAPARDAESVDRVEADRTERHRREGGPALVGQQRGHDAHLDGRRDDVQHRHGEHGPDRSGTPLDYASERSRLPVQVERQVERHQVVERAQRHAPDGVLGDV
eukprot:scaffold5292_cov113-Isochrysis_galbana.AAC.4